MTMSRGVVANFCVFAVAIIVVIAGFFLLNIERVALNFWALGSLLLSLVLSSIVVATILAPKRDKDAIFYAAGLSVVVVVYQIAVIISMFFTQNFADDVNSFIFLQIIINALLIIAVVIIVVLSNRVHKGNAETYRKLQDGEYNQPKRGGF
jgi:hypothetical protein